MRIGFIGVGNIGNPMAGQLFKAGHALVIHDKRIEAAASLLAAGATWADSPRAVARQCEVVATCLPGPVEMEQVALGADGILAGASPGTLYIDHTTNAPGLVRRVHALFQAGGVEMLDAPVSGGMEGAQTRDLLVMVGGAQAAFARAKPLLEALAKRVMHTGEIGCGCICKLMHNCAVFTLDQVMAECWTTGVKAGVAPEILVEVFTQAALGHMTNLKVRLPDTYLRGDFMARFALQLARKDVGLATALAREYNVPMRLATLCEQDLMQAMERGWAAYDASIVLTLQEERARTQVRLPQGVPSGGDGAAAD
jgi:3-hydroxyisobutyrate dehydrogenase-like beta-hydroxyacid dehydrogenase